LGTRTSDPYRDAEIDGREVSLRVNVLDLGTATEVIAASPKLTSQSLFRDELQLGHSQD
jgi:hypothetical protein